jgi:hypothetical protein
MMARNVKDFGVEWQWAGNRGPLVSLTVKDAGTGEIVWQNADDADLEVFLAKAREVDNADPFDGRKLPSLWAILSVLYDGEEVVDRAPPPPPAAAPRLTLAAGDMGYWATDTAQDIMAGLSDAGFRATQEQQEKLIDLLDDWLIDSFGDGPAPVTMAQPLAPSSPLLVRLGETHDGMGGLADVMPDECIATIGEAYDALVAATGALHDMIAADEAAQAAATDYRVGHGEFAALRRAAASARAALAKVEGR